MPSAVPALLRRATGRGIALRWLARVTRPLRRLAHAPRSTPAVAALRAERGPTPRAPRALFVTARFRSGSTLLWRMLRATPGVTAYYEPLHPLRPFDPRTRPAVEASHDGVDDYWTEYDGVTGLEELHDPAWNRDELFLPADAERPRLRAYLETLVAAAPGFPVLQLNRVDFRLPWLRATFPDAYLLHLHRDPRDQFVSSLRDPSALGESATHDDLAPQDAYGLALWARSLRRDLPVLDTLLAEHPYDTHYLLWRLSRAFGTRYADRSIAYEDLLADPAGTLGPVWRDLGHDPGPAVGAWSRMVDASRVGRGRSFASEAWFAEREQRCDALLRRYVGDLPE